MEHRILLITLLSLVLNYLVVHPTDCKISQVFFIFLLKLQRLDFFGLWHCKFNTSTVVKSSLQLNSLYLRYKKSQKWPFLV